MIQALIGPATKLLGKFIEDKDQKNKLAHDLATLASRHAQELAKGQIAANAEQAKHPSIFVAGARPAIMWICALGLLTQFFIMPIAEWATMIWMPEISCKTSNGGTYDLNPFASRIGRNEIPMKSQKV